MNKEIRLVGILGTVADGTIAQLLDEAFTAGKRECEFQGFKVEIETICLVEATKTFHDGLHFDKPPWFRHVFGKMERAHGLLYATPVNHYTMSALMKNCIDYTCSYERLDGSHPLGGKVGGALTHAKEIGAMKTLLDMWAALNGFGIDLPGHCLFPQVEDGKEKSENQWMMTDHRLMAENVVRGIVGQRVAEAHGVDFNDWEQRF